MLYSRSKSSAEEVHLDTHILVVEDEPSVGEIVQLYLRRAGFQVTVVQNGQKAQEILETHLPSLLILDLMLPGVDGWEITRRLRAHSDVPIIMLTARREEVDRIAGLELGADDYVLKPFSPQELVSRVRAVLRRAHPSTGEEKHELLDFGDLQIDATTRLVTREDGEKNLTAREFDLLFLMAQHPRQVFTRDQLLERVWGEVEYIDPGTVTVHIRRLREKIEPNPAEPRHLQTVWGVGYRFEP
ncbi:MAG: response regulator transcription factor [Anaerolineaceae bacterium]|nr:response regulator transcription factor [Anaerolineaceae bacterium]